MTAQTAILLAAAVAAATLIVVQALAIARLIDERDDLRTAWLDALAGWDEALDAEQTALAGWREAMDDHERTLNAIDVLDPS